MDYLVLTGSKILGIPIDYFFKNVNIQGMNLLSPKLSELLINSQRLNEGSIFSDNNINCFYIIDFPEKLHILDPKTMKMLESFLADRTLEIRDVRNILMGDNGKFARAIELKGLGKFYNFRVYEYQPRYEQPCYTNEINPFPSTPEDKTLLDDYFLFQKYGKNLLEKKIQFDSSGRLDDLKIKYILSGGGITHPVRLKIHLRKNISDNVRATDYDLKITVDLYSWGIDESDKFLYKELDLYVFNGKKSFIKLPVISKESWITNGYGINKDKFSWYRNFKLESAFQPSQDKIIFKISGKIFYREREEENNLNTLIPIVLKR